MDTSNEPDDKAVTIVVDFLMIRDGETGEVIWNQRGSVVPLPIAETPRNDYDSNPED